MENTHTHICIAYLAYYITCKLSHIRTSISKNGLHSIGCIRQSFSQCTYLIYCAGPSWCGTLNCLACLSARAHFLLGHAYLPSTAYIHTLNSIQFYSLSLDKTPHTQSIIVIITCLYMRCLLHVAAICFYFFQWSKGWLQTFPKTKLKYFIKNLRILLVLYKIKKNKKFLDILCRHTI